MQTGETKTSAHPFSAMLSRGWSKHTFSLRSFLEIAFISRCSVAQIDERHSYLSSPFVHEEVASSSQSEVVIHYGFRLDSSVDFLLGGESRTGYRLLSPESVSLFFCLRAARIARRSQGMLPGYLTVSSLVNTRVIWPFLPVFCWHCSSLALITGAQLLFCRFHFFSRP